jgi:molybdate transport system substrate-binding protein
MGVGVATRKENARPDVSTVPAFKSAMLAARSITFADPAFGGQSGIHVAKVFEQLGIAQEVKPRLQLRPGAPEAFKEVARGEIEIGLGQISEILANQDIVLIGPLPAEIQSSVEFSAGLHASAGAPDVARAFTDFIAAPAAKERFRKLGFEVR